MAPAATGPIVKVDSPMSPPEWAILEQAVLKAGSEAAPLFAERFFDDRGFLECVESWGGNDGPDDAMENLQNWPLLYALGGSSQVLELFSWAWEGHLRQFTQARVPGIPMAEAGMYYKEFITSFDWEHNGEGLAAFYFYGLARPDDPSYLERVRRFAGFYLNEDPEAPNYDPRHKIIRSLHNGSRGPKLTPATEQDWGGAPVPGDPERLSRYSTAANIRGDHPLNLCAVSLPMTAFLLTQEEKYRNWILEYVAAWRDRILGNNGNIPTNIGLDGRIGGEWDGKWYGGVFGWNFWPQSDGRNYYIRGPRISLGEALMLTGDLGFAEPLRRQIDNLYAAQRVENGRILLPNKHGDQGWYGHVPNLHFDVQRDIYLWSLNRADMTRIKDDPWIAFLDGRNPGYPSRALRSALEDVRRRVQEIRQDRSTPDTRRSDYPQRFNPVQTSELVNLTLGGNDPGTAGNILHSAVRYFDAQNRRPGLPEGVGALVSRLEAGAVTLTLVNTDVVEGKRLIVQTGAYGEHQCEEVRVGGNRIAVNAPRFEVELAPGAGAELVLQIRRYQNQPSLRLPW